MDTRLPIDKKLVLVYDYISPYSLVPNGLNYRYMSSHIKYSFDEKLDILPELSEKYYEGVSVYDGEYLFHMIARDRIGIFELPENDLETMYLYSVSIHGNPNPALGYPYSIHENFPFTRFISLKTLDAIKNRENLFLFINYTTEGILDEKWFNTLYKELSELNIPPNKVIFASAAYTLSSDFNNWYKNSEYKIGKLHTLPFNWTFPTKHIEYKQILNFSPEDELYNTKGYTFMTEDKITNNVRPYKFLMFNRRLRDHRISAILFFYFKNIINKFLISYDFINKECNILSNDITTSIELLTNLIDPEDVISTHTKILREDPVRTIDYDNIGEISGVYFENYEPYLNSYINVVTETNFSRLGGYISEKTTKPIANLQPFIIFGTPYTLDELKKLGFKTFAPFIDEEYDNIEDNNLRFKAIVEEVYRISQMSDDKIHSWYMSILPTLKHNQNLLFDNTFFEKYLISQHQKIFNIYETNTKCK